MAHDLSWQAQAGPDMAGCLIGRFKCWNFEEGPQRKDRSRSCPAAEQGTTCLLRVTKPRSDCVVFMQVPSTFKEALVQMLDWRPLSQPSCALPRCSTGACSPRAVQRARLTAGCTTISSASNSVNYRFSILTTLTRHLYTSAFE